ncbi:MAG TPA: Gfo/Idh/MocA family oxidoreductase [Armatimonadota bacterium]
MALKVGIIGTGGIAGVHYPGWKDSPHTELFALADPSTPALEKAGAAQGIDLMYEDPYDLIGNPEIDIVDICTPNAYHTPLAVAALNAGKHVICEKPLAPTPDDIRKMIAARDASGKMLMTAQHMRFQGTSVALKAEIDSGTLGNIYHARSWMLRRAACPVRPGFIIKEHSGGGPCIDIGVHILDLTLWMMGHPKPVSVSGVTQTKLARQPGAFSIWGGAIPETFDVEDFASAFVRFENGATLILEVSWMLHHKAPNGTEDTRMWLYGDKGGSTWPDNELLHTNNAAQQMTNTQLTQAEGGSPHAKECMAFADAIVNGKPSPVPAEQSMDVMAILDGLYRSSADGREIRIG